MNICWVAFLLLTLGLVRVNAQTSPAAVPLHECDASRFDGVDKRGDQGMGFSHKITHHHFHLLPDGGAIEVEANKPEDDASRKAIREHMAHIATMFSNGDFALPMFIHATEPPGMKTMQRLKEKISYTVENTSLGAQVRIQTADPEAKQTIHAFLRFQISEHRTGDQSEATKSK
jgi:hypothetical protein